MTGVLFIAGVHGVGKSTAAESLSDCYGVPHYTASEIIREMRSLITQNGSKLVSNVAENQELLIAGMRQALREHDNFILDGHFTLLNKSFEVSRIGVEVFERMSISGIILLKESPATIYSRLVNRDNFAMSLETIKSHQVAEDEHADYISKRLSIPMHKLSGWTNRSLFEAYDMLRRN